MSWDLWNFLQTEFKKIGASQEANWVRKHLQSMPAEAAQSEAEEILRRRRTGEPLAYILGEWEFCSHEFFVGPGVLIPRPETEELALLAVDFSKKQKKKLRVVDLGAGTGAIGISLALACPCHVTFVEKSPEAAAYLKKNAARHLKDNFEIVEKDWKTFRGNFDLVLSNPPYISREEFAALDASVKNFEPEAALLAEGSEMQPYLELVEFCENSLNPGGRAFFEFGPAQGAKWRDLIPKRFNWAIHKDLSGKERFLELF